MSDQHRLKLLASVSKSDEPLIPPLQQVEIFVNSLGYICEQKPQLLPKEPFELQPCPISMGEDLEGSIEAGGIDFLEQYEYGQDDLTITLNICRIMRFCTRHGFHPEDVVQIVLIHELAHFVTHLSTASGACWEDFGKATSEQKEDLAQEATHLLLRVGGYGHLVQVFDALSQLCPPKYDKWRQTWAEQVKSRETLDSILKKFRMGLQKLRKPPVRVSSIDMEDY